MKRPLITISIIVIVIIIGYLLLDGYVTGVFSLELPGNYTTLQFW